MDDAPEGRIDDALHFCRRFVAQHCPRSGSPNSRPQPGIAGQRPAEGGIDTGVQPLPSAFRQPVIHLPPRKAGVPCLLSIDDPVLNA
jgi:hypothetical protein